MLLFTVSSCLSLSCVVLAVWLLNATCSQTGLLSPDFVPRGAEFHKISINFRFLLEGGGKQIESCILIFLF